MIYKIIDAEGSDFGENVMTNSKVLQEGSSLTLEQTASLISGTRTSDHVWRQSRTAFNKTIGFSPIASHTKVKKYREEALAISKDDWCFFFIKRRFIKTNKEKTKVFQVRQVYLLSLYIAYKGIDLLREKNSVR